MTRHASRQPARIKQLAIPSHRCLAKNINKIYFVQREKFCLVKKRLASQACMIRPRDCEPWSEQLCLRRKIPERCLLKFKIHRLIHTVRVSKSGQHFQSSRIWQLIVDRWFHMVYVYNHDVATGFGAFFLQKIIEFSYHGCTKMPWMAPSFIVSYDIEKETSLQACRQRRSKIKKRYRK